MLSIKSKTRQLID